MPSDPKRVQQLLQGAVDWSGVTNRDQAHILLAEIDPGKITDVQRNKLIDLAAAPEWARVDSSREEPCVVKERDQGLER